MFTRRQAIRWAELWLSCWNDADFDTLLAMHRDDTRFGVWDAGAGPRIDWKEAMKRHWGAVPFGLHSVPVEVRRGGVGPRIAGDHGGVYVADFAGSCLHAWLVDLVQLDSTGRVYRRRTACRVRRGRPPSPLCSRTLANGFSARVQEDVMMRTKTARTITRLIGDRRSSLSACWIAGCRIERAIAQRT